MQISHNFGAGKARRYLFLAVCAAILWPGAVVVSAVSAAAAAPPPGAPLPCLGTLVQMVNDALFGGPAGQRKLVVLAAHPGRRLLPATGGASPQDALLGQFGAKTPEGQCAFETTSYAAAPFLILDGLLNLSSQAKAAEKKLESLSPAQKKAIDNFFITGKAPQGTNPLALLGGARSSGSAPGVGPLVKPGYRKLKVKLTKLTPTGATMNVSGLEAGTETIGGHTQTMWAPFTESGIQASKLGGRWFLSGSQGLNLSV